MLRMETETGWWLITHPDHARLAGDFAAAWGNAELSQAGAARPRAEGHCAARRRLGGARCASAITREGSPLRFPLSSWASTRRSRRSISKSILRCGSARFASLQRRIHMRRC